ncbi:MAG: MarC family protein [Gammaproteobacteria bacterium]
MPWLWPPVRERAWPPRLRRLVCLAAAFTAGAGCLIGTGIASAAEPATSQLPTGGFPTAQVFTFLFLMLGPFKIIGPFWNITKTADAALTRRIAMLATLFASLALLVAAFLGETILNKYGIPVPVMALSAGLILFLVALLNILKQFTPPALQAEGASSVAPEPTLDMALSPLAIATAAPPAVSFWQPYR